MLVSLSTFIFSFSLFSFLFLIYCSASFNFLFISPLLISFILSSNPLILFTFVYNSDKQLELPNNEFPNIELFSKFLISSQHFFR